MPGAGHSEESSAARSKNPSGGARSRNSSDGARNKNSSSGAGASADGHAERLASNRPREAQRKLSFQGSRFNSDEDAQPLDDIPESDCEYGVDFFGQNEQGELVEAVSPSVDIHSPDVHEPDSQREVNPLLMFWLVVKASHFSNFNYQHL